MDIRSEVNRELRRARTWLLVVAIISFLADAVLLMVVNAQRLDRTGQIVGMIISTIVLGVFLGLWWLARSRPKLGLSLALALYWILQIALSIIGDTPIYQGFLIKILFTMALVKGIQSAGRAELLRADLEKVFE
jgi:hypothetical protein